MQIRVPDVTLLAELGRGQGGVVYRAERREGACNVKVPISAAKQVCDAFERDALALARLARVGLQRVVQVGWVADTPYVVLEASPGEPFAQWLSRQPSPGECSTVFAALARCLCAIHDAGFLYGELRPESIVIDGGSVTLLDRGSLSRPTPFERRSDVHSLGRLLQRAVSTAANGNRNPALGKLVSEFLSGEGTDLGVFAGELEALSRGRSRRSSFPAPVVGPTGLGPSRTSTMSSRSELSRLGDAWQGCRHGHGRVVEVLGPPGSGKTRLLAAFARLPALQGAPVLSVKCRDSDWAPFSALKRLLDGHLEGFERLEPRRRAELQQALRGAAGPMASLIGALSPHLSALFSGARASIAAGDAQQVFVAGTADFLARYLESCGPSVVVIDDVHWLDASSRRVLSRVATRLCSSGHLVVVGARDDADSREPLERLRSALAPVPLETLHLGPLSKREAGEIVGEYLALPGPPPNELVEQLVQLSDGTPLSLNELLRLTLERGFLTLRWGEWLLDSEQVHGMRLPASSLALVERRLAHLDHGTLTTLRAAAVLGGAIDSGLLAHITDLRPDAIGTELDRARSAGLLEPLRDSYAFIHDSVREAVLRAMTDAQRESLHARAAEALRDKGGESSDFGYQLARHHAAALQALDPERSYRVIYGAARRAVAACDDALALSFLKSAQTAAAMAGIRPERQFHVLMAETSLRTGATKESLVHFISALECSAGGVERAHVRGRIAWVHHFESNAVECERALAAALAELGRGLPRDSAVELARSGAVWVVDSLHRRVFRGGTARKAEVEVLCGLYIECMRVSLENSRPTRAMASVVELARAARALRPCRTVVHADLLMAFLLSVLRLDNRWRVLVERAFRMAREIEDPIAETLCHQVVHTITGWRGYLDESEREARLCVIERGHWMEVGELCHGCFGMYGLEIVRGRPEEALEWTRHAIERVRQQGCAPAVFVLIEDAARSTLTALGRETEIVHLERQLRFVERAEIQQGGYFHLLSYQSRIQRLTAVGDLGPAFEAIVEEFETLEQDPKQVHLLVVVYYLHVAHARVHQCLRAAPERRGELLPKLKRALADVDAAARIPVLRAHATAIAAVHAWASGRSSRAERSLDEAERLAQANGCPWVSYSVARLRAHMLREQGQPVAALDQAQIAAMYAERYGQQGNLRFIREEFQLGTRGGAHDATLEAEAPRARRHLDALLHISRASSRDLGPERQARLILDELLQTLGAERGFLFMCGEDEPKLSLRAARAGGEDLDSAAQYDRELVERVYATGQTEITDPDDERGSAATGWICLVAPLVLRERAAGVLYLERADASGRFGAEDVALLQALANQVPIALELASALRERERLKQNLQQAQKMEAIGRFAGGIAHDFNNILATIQIAADNLAHEIRDSEDAHTELNDILDSSRRGADLTRQLMTFSRGEVILPRHLHLSEVVLDSRAMLDRLVRDNVTIEIDLDPDAPATMADPNQIERVLMNLCRNASDAMPAGGTVTIRVSRAKEPEPSAVSDETLPGVGGVVLSVADTGLGMSEDIRSRLFEPFFTTKAPNSGTGLGLATVYSIVQQCGGHIEVTSEPGAGTAFTIYLPKSEGEDQQQQVQLVAGEPSLEVEELGGETILVVDDDRALLGEISRMLEREGFQVLSADSGEEAIELVRGYDGLLDLALTDLHMPGMSGTQLADELLLHDPEIKLLFISGHGPGDLSSRGLLGQDAAFLQKPFDRDGLVHQVRTLLRPRGVAHAAEEG